MNQLDNTRIGELIRAQGWDPIILLGQLESGSVDEFDEDLMSLPDDLDDQGHRLYLSFLMHLLPEYREDVMYHVLSVNEQEDEDIEKAINELFASLHAPFKRLTREELENLSESAHREYLERFIRSKLDREAFNKEYTTMTYEYSLEDDLHDAIMDRLSHYLIDDSSYHMWTHPKVNAYYKTNIKKLEDYLHYDVGYSLTESRAIIKNLMLSPIDTMSE